MDEVYFYRLKKKINEVPNLYIEDDPQLYIHNSYKACRLISELVDNFGKQSFEILRECVASNNEALLEAGYSGLALLGTKVSLEHLIELYEKENDVHKKSLMLTCLGTSTKKIAADYLVSLTNSEKKPELLSKVQITLTQIFPTDPDFISHGLKSLNGFTRFMALREIIENDPSYFTVDDYLKFINDPYGDVRGEAFKQLLVFNRKEDLPLFYDGILDQNWHVASASYKYLSRNLTSITPEIRSLIKAGGGANFQRAIIQFLKLIKDPSAIPILAEMLISESSSGRRFNMVVAAIKSYKKFPEAAEAIFTLLQDRSFNISAGQATRYYLWNTLVTMKAVSLLPKIREYVKENPVDEIMSNSALEELELILK